MWHATRCWERRQTNVRETHQTRGDAHVTRATRSATQRNARHRRTTHGQNETQNNARMRRPRDGTQRIDRNNERRTNGGEATQNRTTPRWKQTNWHAGPTTPLERPPTAQRHATQVAISQRCAVFSSTLSLHLLVTLSSLSPVASANLLFALRNVSYLR